MSPDAVTDEPIRDADELLEIFRQGAARGAGQQLLGTESEKFGVLAESGKPMSYDGRTCGIVGVFAQLCEQAIWSPIHDSQSGPIIAVERDGEFGKFSITLEPGAQLELSGAAVPTVHDVASEIDQHLEDIRPASEACGVRWLAVGYHPVATPEQLPWVPKERYRVMREYFPTVGTRGLDMMQRTATVQVNLDYGNEEDCMRKLRVGLKLSPLVTAIFANSPFSEGRVTGRKSERAEVWLHTDSHRTGLLDEVMAPGSSYRDYAEWALDVPMYFFKRQGRLIANTGQTFRSFFEDGFEGHRASLADWELHLNTMFPEVRLQRTLEFRSVDSLPRRWFAALPAFWAGLLYDDVALAAAEQLVAPLGHDELAAARPRIAELGLRADLAGETVRDWALRALEVAMEGLSRRARLNADGKDEGVHLEPIAELTARGLSPADLLLEELDADSAGLRTQIIERCDARR